MDTRDSAPQGQNQTINSPKSRQSHSAKWLFGVLIILLIGAAGYWTLGHRSANKPYVLAPYSLRYQAGSGIGFDKPTGFNAPVGLRLPANQAIFVKTDKKSNPISGLMAATQPVRGLPNPDLNMFDSSAASGDFSAYQDIVKSLRQYVSSRITAYTLTFAKPSKFTSANIKSGALSMDYSGAPKAPGRPSIKGKVILVLSPKVDYSFAAYSTDSDWQANQTQWQQIINSLKIDL
jgi:hypothetical protein